MILSLLKRNYVFGLHFLICINFLLIFCSFISAQKLPFKFYSTTDGLAHNRINKIYQDKKGFLWFATSEGLSRFDGYEFINYGVRDGLPNQIINDILEDNQGRIWVAANDYGIALLNQNINNFEGDGAGKPKKFIKIQIDQKNHGANKVNRIMVDSRDYLWCLTDDGLFRSPVSDNPVFTLIKAYKYPVTGEASRVLFEDKDKNVWFGIHNELFETRGEEIIDHGAVTENEKDFVMNALQTQNGRIIVLRFEKGLFEYIPSQLKWRKLHDDLPEFTYFYSLIEDKEGVLWFGGEGGFLKFSDEKIAKFSEKQGFNSNRVLSLYQDREGNIWGGTRSSGIFKLSDFSITSFPRAIGEVSLGISESEGILKTFFCEVGKETSFLCYPKTRSLVGNQFESTEEYNGILQLSSYFYLAKNKKLLATYSETGEYPVVKDTNFHFPDGKKIDLQDFFDEPFKDEDRIFTYFDKQGFLWISKTDGSIYRVKINSNGNKEIKKFHWDTKTIAGLMVEYEKDSLWIFRRGWRGGRLKNGEYESFDSMFEKNGEEEGYEFLNNIPTQVSSVFSDSRGWIWTGSYFDGVFVCKNPADEKPHFERYTMDDGLSSDSVWAIIEDDEKRMYFGTGRGLSRFDPQKNIWNSFTTKDGLTEDRVSNLFKDSQGNIWINTRAGLTKFNPKLESRNTLPPPIYITHIKIAGKDLPISETGIIESSPISLNYSQNNLRIDFVALQFKNENSLTYQYKLEGIDQDWSEPTKNRSVTFANLDSGNYRFRVRAISENGLVSTLPAGFQLRISPPFYLRWWFIALCLLLISAVIYAFYRVRLQKLLEVERTRTLIATDLHDDIGSNLSKISVLSEVAKMQIDGTGNADHKILTSIANISRESLNSMKDIVWAINPQRDSALEMTRKMREQAEEIFVPKDVKVVFSEVEKREKLKLPMNLRRDLFLIYKEAINNIAKHSNCSTVKIKFKIHSKEIYLQIADDGIGFDLNEETNGNGLLNMQKRAQRLNGVLQIESNQNQGTNITIRVPQ